MKNYLLLVLVMLMCSCGSDQQWTYLFNGEDFEGWHVSREWPGVAGADRRLRLQGLARIWEGTNWPDCTAG